jgi:hypothetical protein
MLFCARRTGRRKKFQPRSFTKHDQLQTAVTMRLRIHNIRPIPYHALIMAIFPILALAAANIEQIVWTAPLRALAISAGGALLLVVLLALLLRDLARASLLTTWTLLLFFTYGHLYLALQQAGAWGQVIARHRVLIPVYIVLLALGAWLIIRVLKKAKGITLWLNIAGLFMLVLPLFTIGRYAILSARSRKAVQAQQVSSILTLPEGKTPPDVYYIILDSYTRADALAQEYGFDNSDFLDQLKEMGFYIADCSRSNYAMTSLCLASTLNLDYLDALVPGLAPFTSDRTPVYELARHSLVWEEFRKIGYTRVAFETGFWQTSFDDADVYYEVRYSTLSAFEVMLLRTTAAKIILDGQILAGTTRTGGGAFEYQGHILREQYKLNTLEMIARVRSPKFVFIHIIIPHDPFVFKADGSIETDVSFYSDAGHPSDQEHYVQGYRQQVQYINDHILGILHNILTESTIPPIIVMQGDHGVQEDRMLILNAYYLPGCGEDLYPTITPVNTFRIIFDEYFSAQYLLLPDRSYFSNYATPFDFQLETEQNPACLAP